MSTAFAALQSRWFETFDLGMAASVLRWDQTTYMPPGGATARGRQLALLARLGHESLTNPEVGRLIEAVERENHPADSVEAAFARMARREFDRAVKVPADFVSEMQSHFSESYQAWTAARPANDFARMRPYLEKTLDLSRRYSGFFPGYDSIADPLIDVSDPGMKATSVRAIFSELRGQLVPLVQAIASRPLADNACLRQHAPEDRQLAFGLEVIKAFGYDFQRGRQDKTHHPFMTKFSLGDVRITTRVREDEVTDALFSTLHESGHAMYEQGIDMKYEGSPLADGASSGIHESQSRLWENLVGRSRGFWEHFFPKIQTAFPSQLEGVSLDQFYRAINRVERSLIRTDADEVTYNLHVMLRFDFELDLLEGRLAVKDLAAAWHARMQQDLGLRAPDDRDGALQDVHWFAGPIGGAFQGYTLGNILSAQFFEAACRAHPTIPNEITRGQFATLHGWLRENIYQHGARYTPEDLIRRASGGPIRIEPYMKYLWGKYGPLYGLEPVGAGASAAR